MVTNQRIEWIDIAKGIGIILVIAGHTITTDYSYPLYSFHMPLFFLLAGLFIKTDVGFCDYLYKCAHKIMRPWLWMLIISALICLLIPEWRDLITLKAVVRDLYSANTNVFQNSSLWFLVCLFVVEVLFFFFDKVKLLFENHNKKILFYSLLTLIAMGLLWQLKVLAIISQFLPLIGGRLPFKIDTAFICVLFFAGGKWFKEEINIVVTNSKWSIVILMLLLWSVIAWWDKGINLNALTFGKVKLLFYPLACLGIFGVLELSKLISSSSMKLFRTILSFYGRNSLIIFGFQSLFIRLYLLIMNHICGLDMQLYANNPWGHQLGSFLIVTFAISPIVAYTYERLIVKIKWIKK